MIFIVKNLYIRIYDRDKDLESKDSAVELCTGRELKLNLNQVA